VRSSALEVRDNPSSLSAFLDLNIVDAERPALPSAAATRSAAPSGEPNLAAALAAVLAAPASIPELLPMPAVESQASQAPPAEVPVTAPPSIQAALPVEPAPPNPHHERDDWLKPSRVLLLLVGLTLLGTSSLTRRRTKRTSAAIVARDLEVTRQDDL